MTPGEAARRPAKPAQRWPIASVAQPVVHQHIGRVRVCGPAPFSNGPPNSAMCGINSIFGYGADAPPVDETELYTVREAMIPRGPDEAGIWRAPDGKVGLGHRRLSIIDLSPTGRQPMSLPERPDAPVVVFNGEIYNYRELRAELEQAGTELFSNSDTEILLHLYLRDGAAMVERLRGMFAFAIWDPAKQGMLLARDPLGIKPLYYADDGQTLRTASQVRALVAGGGVDTAPDPAGHAGFFLFGYVPDPHTLYRGVRALPAGTTLWCDADGCGAPRRYFDVGDAFRKAPVHAIADRAERRAYLHDVLADSVRAHLVADVPVGVFLSAGRDSTTLAALAREVGGEDLRTVTLGFSEFRGRAEDETILAETVARELATIHETRWVAREEFAADRAKLFAAMDQPTIDGVNSYFVAKAAAATGLKVALSGVGGDELFGGYPSFTGVPALIRKAGWSRRVPGLGRAFRMISEPLAQRVTSPKYAGLLEYGTSRGDAYLLRRALFAPWELPKVMDPDMAAAGWAELAPRLHLAATADGHKTDRAAISALELSWYMRGQLLRDADWAGMAHSLEIRTPLVDIELFGALAPLIAGANPPGKSDLVNAPRTRLPKDVRVRPKTGFAIPVREWVQDGSEASGERGLRGWARIAYRELAA